MTTASAEPLAAILDDDTAWTRAAWLGAIFDTPPEGPQMILTFRRRLATRRLFRRLQRAAGHLSVGVMPDGRGAAIYLGATSPHSPARIIRAHAPDDGGDTLTPFLTAAAHQQGYWILPAVPGILSRSFVTIPGLRIQTRLPAAP